MAWVKIIDPRQATGLLKHLYDGALKRAGRVFNVIRIQSLRPRVLRSSTQLYVELMHGAEGGLTRARRELIATVVSSTNGCHY